MRKQTRTSTATEDKIPQLGDRTAAVLLFAMIAGRSVDHALLGGGGGDHVAVPNQSGPCYFTAHNASYIVAGMVLVGLKNSGHSIRFPRYHAFPHSAVINIIIIRVLRNSTSEYKIKRQ